MQHVGNSQHLVELTQLVYANDIIVLVDTALNLCQGFLTLLPDEYRDTIRTPYLTHLNQIEEQNNARYLEIFKKASEDYFTTNQELYRKDPELFEHNRDFHLLQLEDQLQYVEFSAAFGKKNWGVTSLRRTDLETAEPVFERYRWLNVLFNRSTLDEKQKSIQAKEILAVKGDASLIDLLLPKDDRQLNAANEKKKGTPFGIFTVNAFEYFQAKIKKILPGKLKESEEQLKKFSTKDRLNVLTWSYYQLHLNLTQFRTGIIREMCETAQKFVPYSPHVEFPGPTVQRLALTTSKVSLSLNSKRSSSHGSFSLPATPLQKNCERFFEQIKKCRKAMSDLLVAIVAHLNTDFSTEELQLAEKNAGSLTHSFGSISLDEAEITERVTIATKFFDVKRAFYLIHTLFQNVNSAARQKRTASFSL